MKELDELITYIENDLIGDNKNIEIIDEAIKKYAELYHKKQLAIYGVVASKRFNKNDLLRAYQAGCLENKDDCVTFGYDDTKELLTDAEKWYKRYTE